MKITKISFLFFFLIVFITLNAQKAIVDSTDHYIELINNPKNTDQLIVSYLFFQQKKDQSIKKDNISISIRSLYFMAEAQFKLGDLYGSETTALKALEFLDNFDKNQSNWYRETKLSIFNHLGKTNRGLYRYQKALKYYEDVLKIAKSPEKRAKAFGNRGKAYAEWGKLELAVLEYEKALKLAAKTKDELLVARLFDNIGEVRSKLNLPEAIDNLQYGLLIRKENKYDQGIISSYISLSNHYFRSGNFKQASYNIKKALKIADASNNIKYKEAVFSDMIDQGDYSRVIEYKKITDSLKVVNIKKDTKYSEAKYNYSKQEKIANEAKLKLKDNELILIRQKSKITLWIAITAFIVLLSIFLFFGLRSKHRKEKLQQVHNTESRISKRIHDELANDVYSAMVQLDNNTAPVSEIVDNLEDIYHKARDLSQEKSTIKNNKEFIEDLKKSLASFNTDETNVIVKGLIADIWIDVSDEKKLAVFRVIKELLVNMRKHSSANLVSVIFERSNNMITMRYVDNGIGSYKKEISKGIGLVNAENRIQTIGGNFIFDKSSEKGLKIMIEIPV
ncbi:tetratricopeptide repeat-containing sensor histidine kinase [Psychroserpens algicola]|uniref:Tetratricopeptide repeat protein n=1 Tax=Psychroserpens algicola TaxID=1719034 RepID=A0ABT0H9S6_9FLAO|nr:tetratricopeptide repeat-containing sensor histidine kinase [Psychroserpens algicola]MCK8480927.1 tetratricopeptide repeat protein [Psychroserpens algicola]